MAVISDTTGYGTASLNAYVPMLKTMGGEVVYQGSVEAEQSGRQAGDAAHAGGGREAIMPWSVNAGFLSRLINTRAEMNWDVPIVGQTTLGSGQTKALLEKPEYWEKVYPNNFRNCSYNAAGNLPPRTVEFVDRLRKAKIDMTDTLLWWIALGYDGAAPDGRRDQGGRQRPEEIAGYWNKVKAWPGVYGTITCTPEQHDGFQTKRSSCARPTRSGKAPSRLLPATPARADAGVDRLPRPGAGGVYALIGITYNVMFSASRVFSFTAGTVGHAGRRARRAVHPPAGHAGLRRVSPHARRRRRCSASSPRS